MAANATEKSALGIGGKPNIAVSGRTISGSPNRNGNDGITNELFQSEREQSAGCQYAHVPNDTKNFDAPDVLAGTTAIENFANFQRFLAPPKPSPDTPGGSASIARGRSHFASAGCALCHKPTLRTSAISTVFALRNREANLYSDLLVHDMGVGLADGVSQGAAGPREFRTAPLWGLGQRIFFLHDGRTSDLKVAIREHASEGSEANGVIKKYYELRESQKQDLLNFLRSL
jgi:CxxC motif-containing protein (DUF1111 family)